MKRCNISFLLLLVLFLGISEVSVAANGLVIADGEKFVYEITLPDGEKIKSDCTYCKKSDEERIIYGYSYNDPYEQWEVFTDAQGRPYEINHNMHGNPISFIFQDNMVEMTGFWNGTNIRNVQEFKGLVTPEIVMILRSLDLEKEEKQVFEVIQKDKYPKLVTYTMFFQVIGEADVSVKAGNFDCKKVLFSLTDWRGLFFKSYQYITNDEHRYLVKMENFPVGGYTELVDYVIPEKHPDPTAGYIID